MSERRRADCVVQEIADALRERYGFDAEELPIVGEKLASAQRIAQQAENRAFAEGFTDEHRQTFDRLAEQRLEDG